jgi:hypothetical protein
MRRMESWSAFRLHRRVLREGVSLPARERLPPGAFLAMDIGLDRVVFGRPLGRPSSSNVSGPQGHLQALSRRLFDPQKERWTLNRKRPATHLEFR